MLKYCDKALKFLLFLIVVLMIVVGAMHCVALRAGEVASLV